MAETDCSLYIMGLKLDDNGWPPHDPCPYQTFGLHAGDSVKGSINPDFLEWTYERIDRKLRGLPTEEEYEQRLMILNSMRALLTLTDLDDQLKEHRASCQFCKPVERRRCHGIIPRRHTDD